MSRRFRGEYTFKVDTKGRVSIPAPFRRVIESGDPDYTEGLRPQFVLVYGPDSQKFLEGYTIKGAQELEDKINRLPNSKLKRKLIDDNITRSHDAEIDPDGRLVLPARLRDDLGLGKEARIVGTLNTFRIVSSEEYERQRAIDDDDLGFDIPEGTAPLDALDLVLGQQGGD